MKRILNPLLIMKKSVSILQLIALAGSLPATLHAAAPAGKKPNVILIMTDQQRADAMGCDGNKIIRTPNLDALAHDGYLMSHAYTSAPSSTPARAGLLTGMSPWHHGMLGYANGAEHYRYEMPQMLRDNGYYTLGIGKMHWNPQRVLHGFHATILDESGRVESPYFMSDYRKWFITKAGGLNPDETGLGWNDHGGVAYKLPEELHPTRWTADVAVDVINNYQGEEPLFLKVSFARPHSPYDPPRRVLDMYEGVEMPKPASGDWSADIGAKVTDPDKNPEAAYGQFSPEYVENSRRHYYAAVTFVDEQIGRVIEALKQRGMYDNSIIIFTSDHGDMAGDHNHWRKTYAYEGSARIPMIMKLPKGANTTVTPGSSLDYPVELRDVLPTFLDATGAEVPADMDGKSMLSLVEQKNPQWRKWIDMEHATCYSRDNYWCGLTDGHIKYIFFLPTGKEQLFDLDKDPTESHDLAGEKKSRKLLEQMRSLLAEHLKERGDDWVKDGKILTRDKTLLYSPNFPDKR